MRARKPPKNDAKTAVAYLRVSTDRQEHGPEAQRAVLESWAARENVSIVAWFPEKDISGADEIADRPELQRALAAVRSLRAGLFVASKRDRLAREVVIAREIGLQAAANGAVVVTADGMSDVEKRPDTFLKQGISDLFAEHERLTIVDRTVQALGVMRRKGFRTGTAPFGFRVARSGPLSKHSGKPLPLELDPREQEICAYIVRRAAEGWSTRRIERDLRERKIQNRAGGSLMQTQIQRIIASCDAIRAVYPEHAGGRGSDGIEATGRSHERRAGIGSEVHGSMPPSSPDGGKLRATSATAGNVTQLHRSTDGSAPIDRVAISSRPAQGAARIDNARDDRSVGDVGLRLACARGHVFDNPAAENSYCTRGECAAEKGTYKPERRIEWRTI